jgi:hypothetical protein
VRTADLDAAAAERREAAADLLRASARADEAAAGLARAERKIALLVKERDGLKGILASYDDEYLTSQQGVVQVTPQQKRVAELEAMLELLQAHGKQMEEEAASRAHKEKVDTTFVLI